MFLLSSGARAQPVKHCRNDKVSHLNCGDVVVGAKPPVRQLPDQRGQCVGHHPGRDGHLFATFPGGGDEGFDVADEPLVEAASTAINAWNSSSFEWKYQ